MGRNCRLAGSALLSSDTNNFHRTPFIFGTISPIHLSANGMCEPCGTGFGAFARGGTLSRE